MLFQPASMIGFFVCGRLEVDLLAPIDWHEAQEILEKAGQFLLLMHPETSAESSPSGNP